MPDPVPPIPFRRPSRLALATVCLGVAAGLALPALVDATTPAGAPASGHTHQAGPAPADFLPIAAAPPVVPPVPGPGASTGTFTSRCGRNAEGHRNADNVIASPGVDHGAHHVHDYVGNLSTDHGSTDAGLAAAGTTCGRDDRSAYFWPVLRDLRSAGDDGDQPGGGADGNLGRVLTPAAVAVTFLGNPQAKVTAMPRFLRISAGDPKAATGGGPAATTRVRWSCSGVPGRAMTAHYPLCPPGQLVRRTADYPPCWDGESTASADYRRHVVPADPDTGGCPIGTVAVPQLRVAVDYQVPAGPSYAVDTFPEQLREPIADHFDFIDVMPDALMRQVVDCINGGRRC